MALNPLVDTRHSRFVLFEMLDSVKFTEQEKYSDFDREIFESVLDLAEQIAFNRVYPANIEGDKIGAVYDPQSKGVTVPEGYKSAMEVFNEAGFSGLCSDPQWGGMGLPSVVSRAALEYFFSASVAFTIYATLANGAAHLVKNFYEGEHKDLILEKMVSGEWGGTMCLTEPEAGSDVGALKTKAVKQHDGTYRIFGQKIFISAGENDLYENIIHPVLARIEGDPAGTKGISIFLVPKYLINPDGSIGAKNDVVCSGIEHKMGIKASATCSLSFGDEGNCAGYLMGRERMGMKIMFQMMNDARLDVALQGLAVSSSAYMHAVKYAKNRVQGKNILELTDPDAPSTEIINHPDVKRMLLWMKSHVEAMRMLMFYAFYNDDLARIEEGESAREARALLEFLIPICKSGNTDNAWLIVSEAIQVHGGYGYCGDYPVEQLARDSKILSIYEGTNGIQAMDLMMRKLLMNPDMYNYAVYKKRFYETVESAEGIVDKKYIEPLVKGIEQMDDTVHYLNELKRTGRFLPIFANAVPLQHAFVIFSYAWMHLRALTIAIPQLDKISGGARDSKLDEVVKDNIEAAFYHGVILSSRFYIGSEFNKFEGYLNYIKSGERAVEESSVEIFTGAPEE